MVRHMVAWNFKEGFTDTENRENAIILKNKLESLKGEIDGIVELAVIIDPLPSGNRSILLDSLFVDEDALKAYVDHPKHKEAGLFVRSVTQDRASVDYIV